MAADEHSVLVLGNAGWHVAKGLRVPANLSLLFLRPYSPELNPAERVWAYLRGHHLASRAYADHAELLREADAASLRLDAAAL